MPSNRSYDRLGASLVSVIVVFPFQASQVHIPLVIFNKQSSCCKPHCSFVIFCLIINYIASPPVESAESTTSCPGRSISRRMVSLILDRSTRSIFSPYFAAVHSLDQVIFYSKLSIKRLLRYNNDFNLASRHPCHGPHPFPPNQAFAVRHCRDVVPHGFHAHLRRQRSTPC